jgi:IPT/TIG domain
MHGFSTSTTGKTGRSYLARVIVALVVALGIVPVSAGSSSAITGTVDSSSYGLKAGVTLLASLPVTVAATPVAAYPAGPTSNSVASVTSAVANVGAVSVAANGDPLADTATGSSSVAGLNLLSGTAAAVGATGVVGSTCTADGSGATASASVAGLTIPGAGTIPANPGVNSIYSIKVAGISIATVTLNEQAPISTSTTRGISVTALHLKLLGGVLGAIGTGDIYVGHSECTTTIPSTPTIGAISPVQGPQSGGTTVTIDGTNFLGVSQVLIGGTSAAFTRVDLTRLTATTPAHAPGATSVQVINPAGTATAAQQFTYLPTPTVSSLSPISGPAAGGTTVTLTGTNFTGATGVTFDGTPATSYTVVNSTTITAVSPAGTGTDFVQVTGPGGTSATSAATAFTYVAAPTLTSLSPTSGPTTGGTTVTLTGTNFTAASTVKVDGVLTPVTYVSDTQLQVIMPSAAAGPVGLTVTTVGGTTAARTYTYLAVPTVSSLLPASGTTLGGTSVTVTGTGLGSVTNVKVDGTTATVTAQTGTSLTFTTPLHLPGAAAVVLTGPGSITTAAGNYTYVLPGAPAPTDPTVTSLSPASGSLSGGTTVTVTGTNLAGTTAVSFGGVAANGFTNVNATTVTATAPPASSAGPVSVTVTTAAGTSAVSLGGTYVYLPLTPTLSSLSPTHGPDTGGTTVTLTGSDFTIASTVLIDNTIPVLASYVDASHLRVTMPPHTAGTVDLTVNTALLQSGSRTYTYDPTPTVTGLLNPVSGTTAGGTTVTVTGTHLDQVTTVDVDGTAVTPDTATGSSLTFVTPAHATGAVSILLRDAATAGAASFTTNAGSFLFVTPLPVVTGVSPAHGPLAGGTTVTITGTGLSGTTAVSIGGSPATIVGTPSAGTVTVTTPASTSVGPAALTLTSPGGTGLGTYTYDALPTVLSVLPGSGPDDGGTVVTVLGTGFTGATAVKFGTTNGTALTVNSDLSLTVTSPPGSPGMADVTVVTPSGTSAVSALDRFTYLDTHAVPTVSGVLPAVGPTTGGTLTTLTGTGFTGTTAVTFGGTAGTAVTVLTDTTILVTSPAHAAGAVDVRVTDPNGTSATSSDDRFTYVAPGSIPVVTGVTPAGGPPGGGTAVTISGIGFTGASAVAFGGNPATSVTVVNDTTITAVSPAGSVGSVDVRVTNPTGQSLALPLDLFTYVAAPSIVTVLPGDGPTTGGTTVALAGTGFTGATAVTFGGVPGTDLAVSSDLTLTVTTPAHAAGAVPVVVVGPGGSSAPSTFTYDPAPAVTSVVANTGTTDGGDLVTVNGSGFTGATAVRFDGVAGTPVLVLPTSILVTTPAHAAGVVDVTVESPNGTSAIVPGDQFTYVAPAPTLTGLSPGNGPAGGGTTLTLTGTGFTGATAVNFDAVPGTDVAVASDTSLTVTSPAHAAGASTVTVVGPGGTSAGQPFTFNAAPAISLVLPANGPAAGGTSVTLTGTGFTGATAVRFGTTGAAFTPLTDTLMIAVSPPHAAGVVDITVLGPNGASSPVVADRFTYDTPAAPTALSVLPASGPAAGGTTVTLAGLGFTDATAVSFGGVNGTNLAVSSDLTLTVTVPAHAAGAVPVVVTGPGGPSAPITYTYVAAPAITSIAPSSGSTAGGTTVTVTGTDLGGATSVKFGNVNGTAVSATSTSITVTSPAHVAGPVDVRVVTPNGTSPVVAADEFTYVPPAPTLTGATPSFGPVAGGTPVTLTGTGLTGATAVHFGFASVVPVVVDDSTLLVFTPAAAAAGSVPVTVTTAGGTSSGGANFSYTAVLPTIASISPTAGSTSGGTTVTVTGSGFTGATGATIGGVAVTGFTVVNDSTIRFTTPAHTAGDAAVTVTGLGGTVTGPDFTFVADGSAPVITGISPADGPAAGGTRVTLTGVGFTGATQVLFGGVAGTDLRVIGDTSLTVVTPSGADTGGSVSVAVVGPNGTSTVAPTYRYVPLTDLPTISSITPDVGPVSGGTRLTIRGTKFDQYTTVTFDGVAGLNLQLGPDVGASLLRSRTIRTDGFHAAWSNFLTVDSPAHASGPVTVTVTNAAGSMSFVQSFTFIPTLAPHTFTVKVTVGTSKTISPEGPDYSELKATACSDPTGAGSATLVSGACRYTAPATLGSGSDRFAMAVTDVLGQSTTQTVSIDLADEDGGTGTGTNSGNETNGGDGGTGTGTNNGNETDDGSGSGSGSGSGGLAFTGTPLLLVPGLIGSIVLLLVGAGLLTGDRLRGRVRSAGLADVMAAARGRDSADSVDSADPANSVGSAGSVSSTGSTGSTGSDTVPGRSGAADDGSGPHGAA